MKLNPEGVEKAAGAAHDAWWNDATRQQQVTAALTAYFDHLKQEGLMQELSGWVGPAHLERPVTIIRTDKE